MEQVDTNSTLYKLNLLKMKKKRNLHTYGK